MSQQMDPGFSSLTQAMQSLDLGPSTKPKCNFDKCPGRGKNAARVTCTKCRDWFHCSCLKTNSRSVDHCAFVCPLCIDPDGYGSTGLTQAFSKMSVSPPTVSDSVPSVIPKLSRREQPNQDSKPCGNESCSRLVGRSGIQCSACPQWFHFECAGLRPRARNGGWTCPACTISALNVEPNSQSPKPAEPSEFPTFFSSRQHVLKRVPKGCRQNLAELLSKLFNTIVADVDNVDGWLDLLSCARLCLNAPKRGGKKHNLATIINAQIRNFHPSAWKESKMSTQSDRVKKSEIDMGKIVAQKIEAGDVKGAIRILSSDDSLAPHGVETYTKLLDKHPPAPPDSRTPPPIGERHVAPLVTPKIVDKLICSFPAGSAGGPDCMRPQILKDMIAKSNGETRENFLNSLTSLLNLVLAGKVPESIRPLFFSANLFALSKKCRGIRPIAVGNSLRRLASKCLGSSLRETRQSNYGTVQLGYGTALGAEAAAHAARNYIARQKSENHVLLKIDLENAFNSVRRDCILEAIDCNVPAAFPYTLSAYGAESFLFYGERQIMSALGAQQGDPEGPALFSDTINQIIQQVQTELNLWYLDDGNLADRYDRVLAAFKRF